MNRRVVVQLFLIIMLLSAQLSFASPAPWAEQAVVWLKYSNSVPVELFASGTEQTAITREQFCELAVRLYALAKGETVERLNSELPFKDTTSLMVGRAYHLGIVKGLSADTFGPQQKITREQLATMLYRELKILGIPAQYAQGELFADHGGISSYASDAVYFCRANGLVNGVGLNKFAPQNNTTIEQAQLIVFNILKRYEWTKPIEYSVSKVYKGFKLPSTSDLSISADEASGLDLRIILPVRGSDVNWSGEKNQWESFGILRSNTKVPYLMAEATLLQAHNLWDATQQQYRERGQFYIQKDGTVSQNKPTQLPYIALFSNGTLQIDVQLP